MILGPSFFSLVEDSLLRRIRLPAVAYADDVKFVADVIVNTQADVQAEVDSVVDWSNEHDMPLSIEKCLVMHCGRSQPNFAYNMHGSTINCAVAVKDLGVLRSSNFGYEGHYQAVAAKANRMAGIIRHSFQLKCPQLLWPAFQQYVAPTLMYNSPAWRPYLRKDIALIERVQRRYTKCIRGLVDLSYDDRLKQLNAMSVENKMACADLILAYKAIHGLVDCPSDELGLSLIKSCTRGNGIALKQQKTITKAIASAFPFRVPSAWNKLPRPIITSASLPTFKKLLRAYFNSEH